MSTFNLANSIKVVNPVADVDSFYGTYATVEAACIAVPLEVRALGKTVGIETAEGIIEYWWKIGITDEDLVVKVTKEEIGLPNVNNTSDENKPVSIAQKAYVDAETSLREAGDQSLTDALEAVASGSPKGSYANEAALKSADPDHTYTYVTIDTGKWYYWDTVLEDWEIGGDYQAALDIVGELGNSETKVVNQKATTINNLKAWAIAESFSITNPTFDDRGNLTGSVITWPDGDIGSISNVVTGTHGVTSIRYNRSVAGQYVTVNITYNSNGIFQAQEALLTEF